MGSGMLTLKQKGDWKKTHKFLEKYIQNDHYLNVLEKYGKMGVEALSEATPKGSGKTADSWSYKIRQDLRNGNYRIVWSNSNVVDSPHSHPVNVALILQYGHATNHGGYVEGIDYINPAIQPIFEEMARKVWEEVTHK